VAAEERDLIKRPLSLEELRELAQRAGGVQAILATKSPAYRKRAGTVHTDEEWLRAMAEEPRLIKRPILMTDDGVIPGFQADQWRRVLE
jgi:arsenate reductase-like glutaredoxin family protein